MLWAAGASGRAPAQQPAETLPSPVSLADVIRIAGDRRDEIEAARARVRAGEARPTIVAALADPMISPSLDHLPFMLNGADVSVAIEQQIPLSGIRGHRRASSLADLDRLRAEANRTTLDVGIQAANAYLGVGVGEHVGYFFTGLFTLVMSALVFAQWRYLSIGGFAIAAGVLFGMLEPFGVALAGPVVAIAFTAWAVWTLVLGVLMLRPARGVAAVPVAA